mgnify:FL=1
MIGRYVLATAVVVLLVVGLLLGTVVYLGLHYGAATDSRVRIGTGPDPYRRRPAAGPRPHARGLAAGLRLGDGAGRRRQCDLAA